MHALINRAVDEFLGQTYPGALSDLRRLSGVNLWSRRGPDGVRLDMASIARASAALDKTPADMLEDLGAWLARQEPVRRLLRFSGRDFREFVNRLDELPGRARLVMPDLAIPCFGVTAGPGGMAVLTLVPPDDGVIAMLAGILRAMADDYGALGLISVEEGKIMIEISDDAFAEGREFHLRAAYGPRHGTGY